MLRRSVVSHSPFRATALRMGKKAPAERPFTGPQEVVNHPIPPRGFKTTVTTILSIGFLFYVFSPSAIFFRGVQTWFVWLWSQVTTDEFFRGNKGAILSEHKHMPLGRDKW
jgi:hypothetical protein